MAKKKSTSGQQFICFYQDTKNKIYLHKSKDPLKLMGNYEMRLERSGAIEGTEDELNEILGTLNLPEGHNLQLIEADIN